MAYMDDAFRDEGVGTMKLMPLIYAGLMLPILTTQPGMNSVGTTMKTNRVSLYNINYGCC